MCMDIRRNQSRPPKGVFCSFLAALLSLNGCMMVNSEPNILGQYELKVGANKIDLKISPDGSFSERIVWSSGKVENNSGKWLWANDGISFDQLWIPPEFAPEYILQADKSADENGQPKYTRPGHWFMGAEKHWGTVILPVFPDSDIDFKMVSRPSR
jgi:hypothetical protein